jgi:hypothetical protein
MSRLGIYAAKINTIREQCGLTPAGFRQDGTDAAEGVKRAMLRDLYECADSHLPPGIGPADAGEA